MGDITENISRHELACHCGCGADSMDVETVRVIQSCCDHFANLLGDRVVLHIHSANRCLSHNAHVGGVDDSEHPKARALDFSIDDVMPSLIYEYLDDKYPLQYGLGLYDTFTHMDSRTNGPARW